MFLKKIRFRPTIRRFRSIKFSRRVSRTPASSPFDQDEESAVASLVLQQQQHLHHSQQQPHQRRRRRFGTFERQRLSQPSELSSSFPSSSSTPPTTTISEGRLLEIPLLRLPTLQAPPLPLPTSLPSSPPSPSPTTRQVIERYQDLHQAFDAFTDKENLKNKARRRAFTRLSVVGKTAESMQEHPVLKILHDRVRSGSQPGERQDGYKIGLAIEGGGMRGAVSAGAAAATNLLGLSDAFDAVYGSSAGALIAAFFVSRQLNGTIIYSDILPAAGKRFLDRTQLIPAMGLLPGLEARPVLNLQFLEKVVRETVRLDWAEFWKNNQKQPLNIVASSLDGMESLALTSERGDWSCFEGLMQCLKSSMCVPGVAGPPIRLNVTCRVTGEKKEGAFADALVFEPIPLKSAVEDGCTHIVTLRTRPDGSEVLGHKVTGIYERFIARRFLAEKHSFGAAASHMTRFDHLKQYAADLLLLNEGSHAKAGREEGVYVPDGKGGGRVVHLLPVAPPLGTTEVDTLDSSREALRRGLKDGFAAAWNLMAPPELVEAHSGERVAKELFDCEDVEGFNSTFERFSTIFGGGGRGEGKGEWKEVGKMAAAMVE
ncbi:Hypothetical protein NocV09_01400550 [Nannochloropsis oceanica]